MQQLEKPAKEKATNKRTDKEAQEIIDILLSNTEIASAKQWKKGQYNRVSPGQIGSR